ncbi:hypothetical protein [Streptomyces scopuliridis]|uniref:hypothetical protein n=1 Tax=Streptomyces scopuliridis TaxID=452529 RepID=UPI0036B189E5
MIDTVLEAVDALAVELGIGTNGLAFTWDQLEAINGILRAHAHELAEQIREAAKGIPPHGLCPRVSTAKGAARLIDPEFSK